MPSFTITPRQYLRLFLGTVALLCGSVLLLNYWEDPFGVYHAGKKWDWIHSRPRLDSFIALHKTYAVTRATPDVIFLGDSRTFNGLDPHFAALPAKTYNLATPGSHVYENLRYLQHAAATHIPTTVVLGVDLRFFAPVDSVTEDFLEDRLRVRPDGRPSPPTPADWVTTLFSAQALACSWQTLLAPGGPPVTYDRGYDANWSQLQEHFDLVQKVLAFNASIASPEQMPYLDAQGHSASMEAFRKMVALCAQDHIRLIVFVLPVHASMLDRELQDGKTFWAWMQDVLQIMAAQPGLHSEFWDFAGYNQISTEAFTQPPERVSRTIYYWEGSHFKKSVGDLVLGRLFSPQTSLFGQRVTLETLPADEARLEAEKQSWHEHGMLAPLPFASPAATTAPVFR